MPKLEQNFTIHPIGQGLFYSGEIKYNGQVKFRMIFDCGCLPAPSGAHEAEHYRSEVFDKEKELDLLVISHFDADHINHIKTLLKDDVKVKRIVMPFATFEERLFLTARYIYRADKNTDLNTVDFIIDPARALGPNLGDDGELYLIDSDPGTPIPPDDDESNFNLLVDQENRFLFSFDPRVKHEGSLQPTDKQAFGTTFNMSSGYKIKDTDKGMLFATGSIKLMEFLFYKKDIGLADSKFFSKVKELFLEKCGVNEKDNDEAVHTKIIEAVKKMKGATAVKAIFKTAMAHVRKEDIAVTKAQLENPNTTALCMLHKNLETFLKLVGLKNTHDHWPEPRFSLDEESFEITAINKIGALRREHTTPHSMFEYLFPFGYRRYHWEWPLTRYPNTLLTSDSFLKLATDVEALFEKYQHYLDSYWLFQVPHHGSEKNADKILLSQMSAEKWNFINYGVSNSFEHPSAQLLSDIVATGHSERLIPINEFQGIKFGLTLTN